jgi:SAM-dependent methyltransferase
MSLPSATLPANASAAPAHLVEMASRESTHWWYVGLRDLLVRLATSNRIELPERPRVLDAGCGAGANLLALRDALSPSYLAGFDLSPFCVEHAQGVCPEADVYVSDLAAPELHRDDFDLVVSCDVCSVVGFEASVNGLQTLAEALAPGGWLILHLPAYAWLFSEHDRAVGHTERFELRQIKAMLRDLGLQVQLATHRMCLLFPGVVLRRLPSLLGLSSRRVQQSDLDKHPSWANGPLTSIVCRENALTVQGVRWPFGSSILAVARKP